MSLDDTLHAIFDADRAAARAEDELMAADRRQLAERLSAAVTDALEHPDRQESELRLRRLADLCAQVPGAAMVDALLAILDHPEPGIRAEAGDALLDVAFERFKEVARGVERALDANRRGPAMQELPFVLTEVRDPDPVPLVVRFLGHPDAMVVASAIEALAGYGDPSAAKHIEPLLEDSREATLDELDEFPTTIGELAQAALEELGGEP